MPEAARIADELRLSESEYSELIEALAPVRNDAQVLLTAWEVEQDIDGNEVWEAKIGGILSVEGGLTAEFQFRVVIVGQELWRGSSQTPDWYRITDSDGDILFEGEVECPDRPGDALGWGRYDTFSPIRLPAFDAVFARLATGRPVIESS
jgi:hypothetical protein